MRPSRMLALGASLLVLFGACTTGGGGPTIRIGSAGFYESELVAEMYAQILQANGYSVERHFGLGERPATEASLESGAIDLKPEYIGSYLEFLNGGEGEASGDFAATAAKLDEYLAAKSFTRLDYTPGQDQNGFVVRQDTASQFNLAKMSDLAPVAGQMILGAAPACDTNPLCLKGLKDVYGIEFKELKKLGACGPDGITALVADAIQVYEVCTTQPGIATFNLVLLEDDKKLQPAENIAPIVRTDFLAKLSDADAFKALLKSISDKLDTQTLLALGVKVDVDKEDVDEVAADWLKSEGLVQ